MKKSILIISICLVYTGIYAQTSTGLCEDLKKAATLAATPEKFKKGEGKQGDMQKRYASSLLFKDAVEAEAVYWNFGKLSNVIQTFAENKPEAEALKIFDDVAAKLRACYPDVKEGEMPTGLRKDLEVTIHPNMSVRLTIYDYVDSELGATGYSVYFDLYYMGE